MYEIILLVVSCIGLLVGGELLVRAASRIAFLLGMSSLMIGLTVVSFGTSAPELFISVQSALSGHGDLAVGNIIGSNISNTLLILGICAVVAPLAVPSQLIRREIPIMIMVSLLFMALSLNGMISRFDGIILVFCLLLFISFSIVVSKRERKDILDSRSDDTSDDVPDAVVPFMEGIFANSILGVFALFILSSSSSAFVSSASEIARWLGVSELVIGLTVVAVGTSLPELITSIVATYRGEHDLAVGNVVGSNIFNILCVLGICSIIQPLQIPSAALSFDIPILLVSAIACLPIMFVGKVVNRFDGLFFTCMYGGYILYLVLISRQHADVPVISEILLVFFIPLCLLTVFSLYSENAD
jgi:cation:H+ antiporter